jgi:hypothetical protein
LGSEGASLMTAIEQTQAEPSFCPQCGILDDICDCVFWYPSPESMGDMR